MGQIPDELSQHIKQLSREVERLRRLTRPRRPRWPLVLSAVLFVLMGAAVWQALRSGVEEAPPVVAPITPTGDAAQRLWLP